ncbi:MAG: excinuclease ABC subunit UvrA [Burkholderiales bacterium]|nr:excinuclease ABC subunit UvrA [Burkholderiales bacterium]
MQKQMTGIQITGANQNNLKNLDVSFEYGKLTVVTGVSGSGKSSLVFDTLYAEGQRRYVETFSPYVRQFMDRMDRPKVGKIEGVPPAIAIDQTNPVRTSRSTVGTMTEINDHLKMLFAQAGKLFCRKCGKPVKKDNAFTVCKDVLSRVRTLPENTRLYVTFLIDVPKDYPVEDVKAALSAQGYTRVKPLSDAEKGPCQVEVIAGRFKRIPDPFALTENLEASFITGKGKIQVRAETPDGEVLAVWKFSEKFSCEDCGITYSEPHSSTFSFNSAAGACDACKGFGRIIGIEPGLVIPDESKSLREGAVKPWTTPSFQECQDELIYFAQKDGIDPDVPFKDLPPQHKKWLFEGDPTWEGWTTKKWYGINHFFEWLETKAYKMHVRVLLSKYRGYTLCPVCKGSRLKPDAQSWRIGTLGLAEKILAASKAGTERFKPVNAEYSDQVLNKLPGFNLQDLATLPIDQLKVFFDNLKLSKEEEQTCDLLLKEIRARLSYLTDVGLGYLTLDRQSRTLSGGEVQRINLTTALGTSLVNTLFVLDEPSIGLHPQDMDRVNSVMRKLRSAGNTLVVVEHDPQVMLAADRILDMGPGPGSAGGRIVFDGTPEEIKHAKTLTGRYLSGSLKINHRKRKKVRPEKPAIVLLGASEHNLKNIDVRIPLNCIVSVAGVSGSGKSTLIQDILVPALKKAKGETTEAPGKYEALKGAELIDEVVFVDQTSIGKTTRSNPALFVGAFNTFRKLFASTPEAKKRHYTQATFSFNSGSGRCPTCEGSGFEHVEMQFLSDVYLSCPDCNGRRYKPETLEVKIHRKGRDFSIADILDLTVSEAIDLFGEIKELKVALQPLEKVGLGYLRLGQPVPTLSGGEAQRLKLAKHLAEASSTTGGHKLFVFDEPTTGLHFDDTAKLMDSLRELIDNGHSVLVVEHNLDVLDGSDWIIELGPAGGDKGGEELFAGTPDNFSIKETPTGLALAAYRKSMAENTEAEYFSSLIGEDEEQRYPTDKISIVNAREHNLKNLTLSIPRNKFVAVTGVSGSGKSTLAFDLVFNEGQRRYLESLNAFARSMVQPASRPDVDAVYGIPPTVAIEQRVSRGGYKSTVATLTEIHHFLRLLWMKLGTQYCPDCKVPVEPMSPQAVVSSILKKFKGTEVDFAAPLVRNRKGIYKDLAASMHAKGFTRMIVDGHVTTTRPFPQLDRFKEHSISVIVATLTITPESEKELTRAVNLALDYGNGSFEVYGKRTVASYSTKRSCPKCERSFPAMDPRLFSYNNKLGWCPTCLGFGTGVFQRALADDKKYEDSPAEGIDASVVCYACGGTRLNEVARNVLWFEKPITDISKMTVSEAKEYFKEIAQNLSGKREMAIAEDAMKEIRSRLDFLEEVGLSYLTLDRSAPTLSGGESQRIRLASQLGTNLQGVCYVLDEPTIGLHPRDNKILLSALEKLASKGNSLLVVEHDEDTIRKADYIIDIGPGAGVSGGRLVAQGTVEDLEKEPRSLTGRYLKHPVPHSGVARRHTTSKDPAVHVNGAYLNNLKIPTVSFPLNRLTVVTGVSGSGKSTLARDILLTSLENAVKAKGGEYKVNGCASISGFDAVKRVLEVDQTPIGKTPRSCPATYVGFWDAIRKLFAETNEAKARGYTPSRFSFNLEAGRCPECLGQGVKTVEMNFLPDVRVECESCGSMRFNDETLAVKWKGKNIGEVLKMNVDEAVEFFSTINSISHPLKLMQEVGLGYLTLGQPSPTLSGGEAQRIKLVTELTKVKDDPIKGRKSPHTLYVLDEPTVGLHMADVEKLIKVLHRLTDAGNTVVVIEHNLDVIAEADWIVDLGPEGGSLGGQLRFEGEIQDLLKNETQSHTAEALREFLATRPRTEEISTQPSAGESQKVPVLGS